MGAAICDELDAVSEVRPPFSPEEVVAHFSSVLKTYGVMKITSDHYAGEWPRERLRAHGIGVGEVGTRWTIRQAALTTSSIPRWGSLPGLAPWPARPRTISTQAGIRSGSSHRHAEPNAGDVLTRREATVAVGR